MGIKQSLERSGFAQGYACVSGLLDHLASVYPIPTNAHLRSEVWVSEFKKGVEEAIRDMQLLVCEHDKDGILPLFNVEHASD